MILFLLYIIIIIFIYERWNTIKSIINKKEDFLPSNFANNSEKYLEPPILKLEELKDTKNMYAMSYLEDPLPNPTFDKKLEEKQYLMRRDIPIDWHCEREWFECHSHLPFKEI